MRESAGIVVALARVAHLFLPPTQVFLPLFEHLLMAFVDVADLAQEIRVVIWRHDRWCLPRLPRAAAKTLGDDPGDRTDHWDDDDQRYPDRLSWAGYLGRVRLQAVDQGIYRKDDGDQYG
jgi:hypothetical protein